MDAEIEGKAADKLNNAAAGGVASATEDTDEIFAVQKNKRRLSFDLKTKTHDSAGEKNYRTKHAAVFKVDTD